MDPTSYAVRPSRVVDVAAIPVGEYLACALLVWFGVSSIRSALALPAHSGEAAPAAAGQAEGLPEEEAGELAEAREYLDKATVSTGTWPL